MSHGTTSLGDRRQDEVRELRELEVHELIGELGQEIDLMKGLLRELGLLPPNPRPALRVVEDPDQQGDRP